MRYILRAAVLALILSTSAGLAEDDLFVPTPKPPAENQPPAPRPSEDKPEDRSVRSLVGTWDAIQKGNPTCGTGMVVFRASGKSGVTGYTQFGDFPGDVSAVTLRDDEVSFRNDYVDVFGDPQIVTWRGTLTADGNTITGRLEGSWQNGCTLSMRKR